MVADSFAVFMLMSDSLSWINIDKFINEPLINYTINPGNTPNIDSTIVFLHLTGRNSVLQFPKKDNKFFSHQMIEAQATVLGFCSINGIMYFSMVPVNMKNHGSATLNFAQATEAEIKQKLSTLK
jgi:hypothetical protein